MSPTPPFFHLHRPASRVRFNTNLPPPSSSNQERYQQLAYALYTINSKYRISWECAELLIELSGGNPSAALSNADTTIRRSQPSTGHVQRNVSGSSRKSRERAITLAGDEGKPPVLNLPTTGANLAWMVSTRKDAVVNRSWHWGDAMSSTITLPSEDSTSLQGSGCRSSPSPTKKRMGSKMGMSGLREMLKALKKEPYAQPSMVPESIGGSKES